MYDVGGLGMFTEDRRDDVAIVAPSSSITYGQLRARVASLASGLERLGLRPGDRVVGMVGALESISLLIACFEAGAAYLPMDPEQAVEQVRFGLEASDPMVGGVYAAGPRLIDGRGPPRGGRVVIVAGGTHPAAVAFDDVEGPERVRDAFDDAAPGAMFFTSGSTGTPNAVVLSRGAVRATIEYDVVLGGVHGREHRAAFAGWSNRLSTVLDRAAPALAVGGSVHICSPDPDALLDTIEREKLRAFFGIPALIRAMIDAQRARPRDLSSVAFLGSGSDEVTPALIQDAQEVLGLTLINVLGSTEGGILLRSDADMPAAKLGSFARPGPGIELRIVRDGVDVPPGEVGELVSRSSTMMTGYWNDPEATARVIRDGWFYTGDLFCRDEDGYYWFKGRNHDIVKRGGYKVSPVELEAKIATHPAVRDVAVVGVDDGDIGESVHAFFTLEPGARVDDGELAAFLAPQLGSWWMPRTFTRLDTFPMTEAGKLDRARLKQLAASLSA